MYFLEKVKTALQNLENHKVLLKDPVGTNEGPWLVMDPVGGSSCVPRADLKKDLNPSGSRNGEMRAFCQHVTPNFKDN